MNWLRGQTIRARITIWSVLVGAVLIAVAALVFLAGVNTIVTASTKTLLASSSAPYEASIGRGEIHSFSPPGEDQLVAVIDPAGRVRETNLPSSLRERMSQVVSLPRGLHVLHTSSSHDYYVTTEAVPGPGGDWKVIAARNRGAGSVVLTSLDEIVALGSVGLVAGFGIATWIVTGLALRPVTRMRERAAELSRGEERDILPVGAARDELSALAETLNTFIESVRAAAVRERQMVADASHELRTPIAVLTTQLQLSHLSSGDAVALEREISAAEETLERLSTLSTSLLTLSRIEAASVPGATPVEQIIVEFLASMDRAIVLGSAHSISVDFVTQGTAKGLTATILADDFAGVIDNLVSNSIAASPRGAVVQVSLVIGPGQLQITVDDSGHGIRDDFLPIAFDRFTRTDAARSHLIGGNGLGLAIVKAIITRAGGEVTLTSRPEGGVRARASIPVRPEGGIL